MDRPFQVWVFRNNGACRSLRFPGARKVPAGQGRCCTSNFEQEVRIRALGHSLGRITSTQFVGQQGASSAGCSQLGLGYRSVFDAQTPSTTRFLPRFENRPKTPTHKGIVRTYLLHRFGDGILWIRSLGGEWGGNRIRRGRHTGAARQLIGWVGR